MSADRIAGKLMQGAVTTSSKDTDSLLAQMQDAVRAGGGRRSRLSVWMAEREGEIAGMIAAYGADWETWATLFIANGLLAKPKRWDADGAAGTAARRRAAETAR